MSTINEELTYLEETKQQIKQAIIDKGQEISENDSFRSYVDKIDDIVTLEEGTTDADATAQDIAYNKTAYVNGGKITGEMPNNGQINITPSTSAQTIPEGYTAGGIVSAVTSSIDSDIVAENIKTGVNILGVTGTYTSDATATAENILSGKTAYVKGQKITGNVSQFSRAATEYSTNPATSVNANVYSGGKYFIQGHTDALTCNRFALAGNTMSMLIEYSLLAQAIGLTADKIKKGVTILGVSGKSSVVETDDATATNSDIASGKTAYVNGNKVVGVIVDKRNSSASIVGADVTGTNKYRVKITGTGSSISEIINSSTSISCEIANNLLASRIGLTADKIKQGVTILGITGTYAGATMKEYASETAMNNDIANIQEGEVVKVVASGTTTHYIKETTMKKLVKEEDTISPQEYTENVDLANDILGEEESE